MSFLCIFAVLNFTTMRKIFNLFAPLTDFTRLPVVNLATVFGAFLIKIKGL